MTNDNNGTNGNGRNGRIEFLKQKLEEDRAALAAEQMRLAKRKRKEDAKLHLIVGEVMVQEAQKDAEILSKLKQALAKIITDEKTRRFLAERGWL